MNFEYYDNSSMSILNSKTHNGVNNEAKNS